MSVAEREDQLLAVIREHQESECGRLLEAALREGDRLIQEAWNEARRRLRRVVSEERERARSRLRSAEAELATHRRMHEQRSSLALLREAWEGLRTELLREWQDPEGRSRWVTAAASEAAASLPPGPRTVTCPATWAEAERQAVAAKLTDPASGEPPAFAEDRRLEAGVVVVSGHARLDASMEGLLADRQAVEARLLALLQRRPTR